MALVGVMVYLDESEVDWLYGQCINMETFTHFEEREWPEEED